VDVDMSMSRYVKENATTEAKSVSRDRLWNTNRWRDAAVLKREKGKAEEVDMVEFHKL
jgi:hypothetical protein